MVKKNSIPDRWRTLTAVGQRVPGSRFIAFKVPLKGVTNQRVTQNQKFTPKDLITAIRSQNEELGLIVDLTNTERYYTTKDLPKSVQYVKLHTAGLKIPDDATIHQFKRVAWKFLAANADSDKLIGVHCTTGINRTGYLICRYLIDVDGWRPLHALSAFSQARGHPIEGTVYIEDIVKGAPRSNVGIDLPPTIDETRDLEDRSDDFPRGRGRREDTIKSLLELIPGNEYVDFDARDRRPLPLMRARSDEYQDEFFNPRLPLGDVNDDVDLRSSFERQDFPFNLPESLNASERFRRPVDFNPDGRFNSGLESRQDFHGSEPRPLMDVRDNFGPRDMQRPRGMQLELMGYDRMRGRQSPVQGFHEYNELFGKMINAEYDDIELERRMRSSNGDLDFRERFRRPELQSMENENPRLDPRAREMIDSLKGLIQERMQTRNTRTLEGPMSDRMNARNAQLVSEPMNEMINPRDRRSMERMHPRDGRFMEGLVNERLPQRDAQGIRNVIGERMHLQVARPVTGAMNERMPSRDTQFMEGPMNNQMNSREGREMEASTNEQMPTRVARLMDLPLNDGLNPREGQAMGNSMNDGIPQRDARALNRPINEMMTSRDARSLDGPVNTRMQPRIERAMEGAVNVRMQPGIGRAMAGTMSARMQPGIGRAMEGTMNTRMQPGMERAFEGTVNARMQPRIERAMEATMSARMQPGIGRAMEGTMNARMQPGIERAMEGTVNNQMRSREGLMNQRMPLRDTRGMEGLMDEQMYQRDVRTMQGPMNQQIHPRNAQAMDGSMNESMYPHNVEYPTNQQRDFMSNMRPFEGRKMNASEDLLRGINRFSPYPSLMKPAQPAEIARGLPRHEARDPQNMLPPSQAATCFPPRSRFN